MARIIRWVALGVLLAALAGWGALWFAPRNHHALDAALDQPVPGMHVGGPLSLVDHTGHPVSDASWPGRWRLIYFGYTFCPDICPTELQAMASALDELGPLASQVVPLFITIDPERDTPAHMAEYVALFDERLIGLTGTPEQIAAVAKAYRVYYAKVTPKDSSTYVMDHSSFLYLMAPDGTLRALFRPGTNPQDLAGAIRSRLAPAG